MVNRYITALLVVLAATGIHPATGGEGIGGGHPLCHQSHQAGFRRGKHVRASLPSGSCACSCQD